MSKSASPDIRLWFGLGSPTTEITQWITSDVSLGGDGIVVDGTVYGSTNVVNEMVGITDHPDVTLEGFYDSVDAGPVDLFETISGTNTANYSFEVWWVASSPNVTSTLPCAIKSFKIMGKVKDITRFQVVLTQRGAVVHVR
jgi:hypothetical protein